MAQYNLKPGERVVYTQQPKRDAINLLGGPGVIHGSVAGIVTNKFGGAPQHHVTGVQGHLTQPLSLDLPRYGNLSPQRYTVPAGSPYRIRDDYDPNKGSHVNVDVGGVRMAYRHPDQGYNGGYDRYQHDTRENSYNCQYASGSGPNKDVRHDRIDAQLVVKAWEARHSESQWRTVDGKTMCETWWPRK